MGERWQLAGFEPHIALLSKQCPAMFPSKPSPLPVVDVQEDDIVGKKAGWTLRHGELQCSETA